MDDEERQRTASFIVTANPAIDRRPGDKVRFVQLKPSFPTDQARTTKVANWDVFRGLLLAVVYSDSERSTIHGSAVVVGPGVALCASHVLKAVIKEGRKSKFKGKPMAIGITSGGAQGWSITNLFAALEHDVCILGLEAACAIPSDKTYYQVSITTRLPAIGETLTIAGFRASQLSFPADAKSHTINLEGQLITSSGVVTEQYTAGRDKLLAPWPSLEIDCPAWGGMSGGPVFDSRGYLVGLIARSMETESEPSPMLCSLIWPVLGHKFDGGWPVRQTQKSLLDLHGSLCLIEKPDALTIIAGDQPRDFDCVYEPWT
jgi:hypothetical protein